MIKWEIPVKVHIGLIDLEKWTAGLAKDRCGPEGMGSDSDDIVRRELWGG